MRYGLDACSQIPSAYKLVDPEASQTLRTLIDKELRKFDQALGLVALGASQTLRTFGL